MADDKRRDQDERQESNAVVPDSQPGTTSERDFGRTDRYSNQDEEQAFNVRNMGDGTSWDSGREASISGGTAVETDLPSADPETPGVKTRPQDAPIEPVE